MSKNKKPSLDLNDLLPQSQADQNNGFVFGGDAVQNPIFNTPKPTAVLLSDSAILKVEETKLEEAEDLIQQALEIEIKPKYYLVYARILRIKGDMDQSQKMLRQALDLDVGYIDAYTALCESLKFTTDDPAIKSLLALDKKSKRLSEEDQSHIKFSLAKMFYDIKENDKAFSYWMRANYLKQVIQKKLHKKSNEDIIKDIKNESVAWKNVIEKCIKDAPKDISNTSDKPIFIVGMPRSGTTLVENILASHSSVQGAGELDFLTQSILTNSCKNKGLSDNFKDKSLSLLGHSIPYDKLKEIGNKYVHMIENKYGNVEHVVDKMPFNYMFAGVIRLCLPNAKIIYCRRNPMDTGLSIFRQDFVNPFPWVNNLENIGHVYNICDGLMQDWHDLFPDSIYDIQYEKLVENQEEETRKLLEYCDLPWEEGCLEFYKAKQEVKTASIYQVRQPIYQSSAQGWKKFEKQLKPLYNTVKHHMI